MKVGYDVRNVIAHIVDYQDFLEIQPGFAANIVIGFGRLQAAHRHRRQSAQRDGGRARYRRV